MLRITLRRVTSLTLIALMATSCSRAVEIPSEQIDDPVYQQPGSYRIRLDGREEYLVRRFTVTDSTVVIQELLPSDQRYRFGRQNIPVTVPRAAVKSISRMETNHGLTFGLLTASALLIALFVYLATSDLSIE